MNAALLLVDLQNDFMPGGPLAVPDGHEILPIVNQLLQIPFKIVIATQDYHPPTHKSFAATHGKDIGGITSVCGLQQILWPVHCVQNTLGADFAAGWHKERIDLVIRKGQNENIDSYSAFFDNGYLASTELESILKELCISKLIIAGLATDYCVKYSVLDALRLGFEVYVVKDACRAVNLHPHDGDRAFKAMEEAGAKLILSKDLI